MIFKPNISGFSEFDHTADVGLNVEGHSREELFANALFGMYYTLYGNINVKNEMPFYLQFSETTLDDLLVRWLSEMNYYLMIHKFLARDIQKITIRKKKGLFGLTARFTGDTSERYSDFLQTEIKAITYHQLNISKNAGVYSTRIIFDI